MANSIAEYVFLLSLQVTRLGKNFPRSVTKEEIRKIDSATTGPGGNSPPAVRAVASERGGGREAIAPQSQQTIFKTSKFKSKATC